ncbi:hypothetical protein M3Y98_01153700 [Aphelenchoides besseyi]|nr:hypothetical protein M3Y98_01153700 [Aphelenchoides besseyi]
MGECPTIYGKVGVYVAVDNSSYNLTTRYTVAQKSLRCYLKSTNYSFFYINVDTDPRTLAECKQKEVVFRKHCAASVYLREVDWMLVLDADTGVVNPNHCIEEWIDDRVDMIFYERFYHYEIACGNYLVRNTQQVHDFLTTYADLGNVNYGQFDASDNGRLLLHILRTVLPEATEEVGACEAIYREAKSFETYLKYVTCVKYTLGAVRVFPGVARIYRRGHSFVRDYQITNSYYGPNDFMMHGWKPSKVNVNDGGYEISVFKKMPDLEKCGTGGLNGWYFNPRYAISTEDIKLQLAAYERQTQQWFPKEARYLPFLIKAETANCYPNCDALT